MEGELVELYDSGIRRERCVLGIGVIRGARGLFADCRMLGMLNGAGKTGGLVKNIVTVVTGG